MNCIVNHPCYAGGMFNFGGVQWSFQYHDLQVGGYQPHLTKDYQENLSCLMTEFFKDT